MGKRDYTTITANIDDSSAKDPLTSGYVRINYELEPYKCPVCDGSQLVRADLYGDLLCNLADTIKCLSCEGTGIIWG